MKAIFATVAMMLLSSAAFAGNCNLPSTKNPDFVAKDVECDHLTGKVTIEKPQVIFYGNERDIIVAQRDGLIKFKMIYLPEELNYLCQQYGFEQYVGGTHTNFKILGKGVFIYFSTEGDINDVVEANKTPYRKSLKTLECK